MDIRTGLGEQPYAALWGHARRARWKRLAKPNTVAGSRACEAKYF
jgi:hypothetical protein